MEHKHSSLQIIPNHYVHPYVSVTVHVREKNKNDIGIICLRDYLECRMVTLCTNKKLESESNQALNN